MSSNNCLTLKLIMINMFLPLHNFYFKISLERWLDFSPPFDYPFPCN